ncbi:hypothetical protein G6F62_013686 [Rhizopus arrhizus]|nr:hypothetical protein G6F62_013686 [Rhizopus arrhizus]
MHVAAFHRLAFGGDRAEHAAIAQQLQGVVLVVHAQVEQVAVALVQFGDRRYEPGIERVVVDRQGDRRARSVAAALGQQFGQRLLQDRGRQRCRIMAQHPGPQHACGAAG